MLETVEYALTASMSLFVRCMCLVQAHASSASAAGRLIEGALPTQRDNGPHDARAPAAQAAPGGGSPSHSPSSRVFGSPASAARAARMRSRGAGSARSPARAGAERDSAAAGAPGQPRPGSLAAEAGAERGGSLAGAAAGRQAAGGPPVAWAPGEEAASAAAVARLVAGAVGRAAGREEARLQAAEVCV